MPIEHSPRPEPARDCNTCGAPLFFARIGPRGRPTPFEAEPVKASELLPQHRWRWIAAEERCEVDASPEGEAYLVHFGTCPRTQAEPPKTPVVRERWERNRA